MRAGLLSKFAAAATLIFSPVAIASVIVPSGQNKLVDGDFSNGFTGWTHDANTWKIGTNGGQAFSGSAYAFSDCTGASCVDPTSSSASFLTQTFSTNPGETYKAFFVYAAGPVDATFTGPNELQVSIDGVQKLDLLNLLPVYAYQGYSFDFTAINPTTTLTLLGREDPNQDRLGYVSVTSDTNTPEPGTFSMAAIFATAALGLGKLLGVRAGAHFHHGARFEPKL